MIAKYDYLDEYRRAFAVTIMGCRRSVEADGIRVCSPSLLGLSAPAVCLLGSDIQEASTRLVDNTPVVDGIGCSTKVQHLDIAAEAWSSGRASKEYDPP
jgi:hypothetical protein